MSSTPSRTKPDHSAKARGSRLGVRNRFCNVWTDLSPSKRGLAKGETPNVGPFPPQQQPHVDDDIASSSSLPPVGRPSTNVLVMQTGDVGSDAVAFPIPEQGRDEVAAFASISFPEPPAAEPQFKPALPPILARAVSEFCMQEAGLTYLPLDNVGTLQVCVPPALETWEKQTSNLTVTRLRSWLPTLATIKVVSMTASRADPHGIAPYILTGVFAVAELVIGKVPAENQQEIYTLLCDSAAILLRWLEYEQKIWPDHSSMAARSAARASQVASQCITDNLPQLYLSSLELQNMVWKACKSSRALKSMFSLGMVSAYLMTLSQARSSGAKSRTGSRN